MTSDLQPKAFKKRRSMDIRKAFNGAQVALLRQAPFYVTVFRGRLMGEFPLNVNPRVVSSLLMKGALKTELKGLRLYYELTDFGKQVLTLAEEYDNLHGTETETSPWNKYPTPGRSPRRKAPISQ